MTGIPGAVALYAGDVKIYPDGSSGGGVPWAQVTGGTVTEYTKPDGAVMEVHTFTADGTLTVDSPGYAEVLIVGAGTGDPSINGGGNGGRVTDGVRQFASGPAAVTVGTPLGAGQYVSYGSSVGPFRVGSIGTAAGEYQATGAGGINSAAIPDPNNLLGFSSSITGTAVLYGAGNVTSPRPNYGEGGRNVYGSSGIVIVAVQKSPPTVSGVVFVRYKI